MVSSERRRTDRVSTSLHTSCHVGDYNLKNGIIWNLSLTGLCLYASLNVQVGGRVYMLFPSVAASPMLPATVAWTRQEENRPPLLGLRFNNLSREQLSFVKRMMTPREKKSD
jgi:hypothetical protein